jgi:O-antigen ligase
MINKLKRGTLFAIINLFYLAVTFIILTVFFRNNAIDIEVNRKYLTIIAVSFLSLSFISALIIFKAKKIRFSYEKMVNFSLLFLLFSSVFPVPILITATVIFIFTTAFYAIVKKTFLKPHPLFYVIAGYYIFQLIGLSWSIDLKSGFQTIDKGISYILIPLAFCFYPIDSETRNRLLKTLFRGIFVFILIGVAGYIFQIYFYQLNLDAGLHFHKQYLNASYYGTDFKAIMAWTNYGHPTFLSFIFILCIGIGIYLRKTEQKNHSEITLFEILSFIIFSAFLIVVLQSRIGMIMYPVGIFACILWLIRKNKRLIWLLLISAVILSALALFFVLNYESKYFHDAPREIMLQRTFAFIHDHIWLGTGTGGMQKIVIDAANPHNQYYGEVLHLGIIGAIVMIGLLGATIYYAFKTKNVLLFYFMILFLILMFIEMPLTIQKGVTFFSLFVSLFIRPEWKETSET